MANSFRAQFAPAIHQVIQKHKGLKLSIIRRALRREWRQNIRTPENAYMVSAWSKECKRQLTRHNENQKPIDDLPLFEQ